MPVVSWSYIFNDLGVSACSHGSTIYELASFTDQLSFSQALFIKPSDMVDPVILAIKLSTYLATLLATQPFVWIIVILLSITCNKGGLISEIFSLWFKYLKKLPNQKWTVVRVVIWHLFCGIWTKLMNFQRLSHLGNGNHNKTSFKNRSQGWFEHQWNQIFLGCCFSSKIIHFMESTNILAQTKV